MANQLVQKFFKTGIVIAVNGAYRNDLQGALKQQGISLLAGTSQGQMALNTIMSSKERCDLIVAELRLTDANAIQVLASLRKVRKLAKAHFILLVEPEDRAHIKAALAYGLSGFAIKPVNKDQLVNTVLNLVSNLAYLKGEHRSLHKYTKAKYFELEEDYQPAFKEYKSLLDKDEQNPVLNFETGRVCMLLENATEGQEYFKKALKLNPKLKKNIEGFLKQYQVLKKSANMGLNHPESLGLFGVPSEELGGKFLGRGMITSGAVAVNNSHDGSIIHHALSGLGIRQIDVVHSGKDLLQSLIKNKPNVLFLDIVLNDANGLQLIKIIRKENKFKNILIILILEEKYLLNIENAYEFGLDGIMLKQTYSGLVIRETIHRMMLCRSFCSRSGNATWKAKLSFSFYHLDNYEKSKEWAVSGLESQKDDPVCNLLFAMSLHWTEGLKKALQYYESAAEAGDLMAKCVQRMRSAIEEQVKIQFAQKEADFSSLEEESYDEEVEDFEDNDEDEGIQGLDQLALSELEDQELASEEVSQPEEEIDLEEEDGEEPHDTLADEGALIEEEDDDEMSLSDNTQLLDSEEEQEIDDLELESSEEQEIDELELESSEEQELDDLELESSDEQEIDELELESSDEQEIDSLELEVSEEQDEEGLELEDIGSVELEETDNTSMGLGDDGAILDQNYQMEDGHGELSKLEGEQIKKEKKKSDNDDQSLGLSAIELDKLEAEKNNKEKRKLKKAKPDGEDQSLGLSAIDLDSQSLPQIGKGENTELSTGYLMSSESSSSTLVSAAGYVMKPGELANLHELNYQIQSQVAYDLGSDDPSGALLGYLVSVGEVFAKALQEGYTSISKNIPRKVKKLLHKANKQDGNSEYLIEAGKQLTQLGHLDALLDEIKLSLEATANTSAQQGSLALSRQKFLADAAMTLKPDLLKLNAEYALAHREFDKLLEDAVAMFADGNLNSEFQPLLDALNKAHHSLEAYKKVYKKLKSSKKQARCKYFFDKKSKYFIKEEKTRDNFGDFLVDVEDSLQSRDIFVNAYKLDKKKPTYIEKLAYLDLKSTNYNGVIKWCKKLIAIDKQSEYAFNLLGVANKKLNKFRKSVKFYIKGIKYHPKSIKLHYNLAILYAQMGKKTEAKQSLDVVEFLKKSEKKSEESKAA